MLTRLFYLLHKNDRELLVDLVTLHMAGSEDTWRYEGDERHRPIIWIKRDGDVYSAWLVFVDGRMRSSRAAVEQAAPWLFNRFCRKHVTSQVAFAAPREV